jgi:predicted dehydrogenase
MGPSFADLMASEKPDGVIVATPNQLHVVNGLESIAAGVPTFMGKPIADDVASATKLVEAAETAGVPLLVGHHRRYNPLIQRAKETIDTGQLGQVLAVHGMCWFFKPDEYFDVPWRREKGAGPVFINLIHDIDNFRYLCGDIVSVQAIESNAIRGNAVEETSAILLRFTSGVLGTVSVSDAIVAPWSWELTTGENPAYPVTGDSCYHIGGTRNQSKRSWWEPIHRTRIPLEAQDPLALQVRHFCRVIRGEETPLVSDREGLITLKVIVAAKEAATTGHLTHID